MRNKSSRKSSKKSHAISSLRLQQQPCPHFGVARRFAKIGFHPALDKNGTMMMDVLNLAPGQYTYDDRPVCIYKKYQKKSAWKRETECEEFSRNLGYRNPEILRHRAFMAKHLGPGSHELVEGLDSPKDDVACPGRGFGTQKKFKEFPQTIPPPGTYFYNVTSHRIHPSITFAKGQRFVTHEKLWWLPPDRYELKGSMRELLDKVVSKRGPYDLFSGDRSTTNTFNKFGTYGKSCAPDKIYDLPTDLDYLLYDREKRRTGKFLKAARFPKKPTSRMMVMDPNLCYRDPNSPGPDSYNLPGAIKVLPEALHSFGTSQMEPRPGVRWTTLPGPGRYNVKHPKCVPNKGAPGTWVFRSKTQRQEHKAPVYNSF